MFNHEGFDENKARRIARVLCVLFGCVAALYALVCVLICLGRVTITRITPDAHYERALLLGFDPNASTRFLFTSIPAASIRLYTPGNVSVWDWLAVTLLGLIRMVPRLWCFVALARLFDNIAHAHIFVQDNVRLLARSGQAILWGFLAFVLACLVLPPLANQLSGNTLSLSGQFPIDEALKGGALLVAAYVLRYGQYLQDEADHTL